jgi:YidC/Oxa1 family membrane protein insertase
MQQQPDNQKNILMAIVLSVAVLLGWQVFYANPKMERDQAHRKQIRESKKTTPGTQTVPGRPGAPSAPRAGAARPGAPTPAGSLPGSVPRPAGMTPAASRAIALKASPRIQINTPSIIGSIALIGGRIDDITLKKYRDTIDPKSPPVVLFSPASSANPYFAEFGWVAAAGSAVKLPDDKTVWNARGARRLTTGLPLKLTWDNGQGLLFTRTISVDESYLFTVRDEVKNKTSSRVVLHPYARIQRDGTPKVQGFFILHEGLIGVLGEKSLVELDYDDAVDDDSTPKEFKDTTGGWLGMTDKYWAAVLIPDQTAPYQGRLLGVPKKDARLEYFQTDYLREAISIPAGGAATVTGLESAPRG